MVPALLVTLLCILVMTKKGAPGGPARVPCKSRTTLLVATLSKIIYFPAVIYSVFLPLQLGTTWFYVGLPITLLVLNPCLAAKWWMNDSWTLRLL